jgi:hypothetical protein
LLIFSIKIFKAECCTQDTDFAVQACDYAGDFPRAWRVACGAGIEAEQEPAERRRDGDENDIPDVGGWGRTAAAGVLTVAIDADLSWSMLRGIRGNVPLSRQNVIPASKPITSALSILL